VPTTFSLFKLQRFPYGPYDEDKVVFRIGDSELRGKPAQTVVRYRKADAKAELEWYSSSHEVRRKVAGRLYDGTDFEEFYQKNEVTIAIHKPETLLACKSSAAVARDLIDELNERHVSRFRADYYRVDFDRIRRQIKEINGIWVGGINQPNIEALAVFGPGVDQSALYRDLKELGEASAILIRHDASGDPFTVILSARGSVTFPQPGDAEQQLDRTLSLCAGLLKPALVVVESRKTAKERRERERALRQPAKKR
jgi:hypothetical protein